MKEIIKEFDTLLDRLIEHKGISMDKLLFEFVDISGTIFQGKISPPTGEIKNLDIMDISEGHIQFILEFIKLNKDLKNQEIVKVVMDLLESVSKSINIFLKDQEQKSKPQRRYLMEQILDKSFEKVKIEYPNMRNFDWWTYYN